MIEGFDAAQLEVQQKLVKEIDWFSPPGEKHFDPVSTISFLAGIMVTAFLAGFVDEAKSSASQAGKKVFKKLEGLVKSVLSGDSPNVDELDALASQAKNIKAELSEKDLILYLENTREHLEIYLKSNLPSARAEKLSNAICEAVLKQL